MASAKKTPKVMDGVHVAATPASSTSRPLIVKNRPIMASDPMLTPDQDDEQLEQVSGAPARKRSAGQGDTPMVQTVKTVKPSEGFTLSDEGVAVEDKNTEDTKASQIEIGSDVAEDSTSVENIVSVTEDNEPKEVSRTAPELAASDGKPPKKLPSKFAADNKNVTTDTGVGKEPVSQEKTIALPTEQRSVSRDARRLEPVHTNVEVASQRNKQDVIEEQVEQPSRNDDSNVSKPEAYEMELQHHIEIGTYAAPINRTGKQQKETILLVVLLLFAVMICMDVLLDMAILDLPGLPHTNFFS